MSGPTQAPPLVELHEACFSYSTDQPALKNVNLKIHGGEVVCLVGSSGIGKSTLLNVIKGVTKIDSGHMVTQDNLRISDTIQRTVLFPNQTVLGNVPLALKWQQTGFRRHLASRAMKEEALSLLKKVGIAELADRYPHEISGGQAQRCEIATSLARKPDLMLMDEPFSALDKENQVKLQLFISSFAKKNGIGVLFVTHDLEEALFLGDRIVYLQEDHCLGELSIARPEGMEEGIKSGEPFLRALLMLESVVSRGEDPSLVLDPVTRQIEIGAINEKTLVKYEGNAQEIWIITRDLDNDLNNQLISETVQANLGKGVKYHYVIPESKARLLDQFATRIKTYPEQIDFRFLPDDDIIFGYREVPIYDLGNGQMIGFFYPYPTGQMLLQADADFITRSLKHVDKLAIKHYQVN